MLMIGMDSSVNKYRSNLPLLCLILIIPTTIGGYVYTFGLYAAELKNNLELTHSQLATLSTAIFCAGVFQWAPGMMVDRMGERFSMLVGSMSVAMALGLYWAIAQGLVVITPRWLLIPTLVTLTTAAYLGECAVYGSIFKVIVKICHETQGTVVGIAKGQLGLGSGVYIVLFQCLNRESTLDFLLLLSAFFFIFPGILPLFFISKGAIDPDRPDPLRKPHIFLVYLSMTLCTVFIVGHSMWVLLFEGDSPDDDVEREKLETSGPEVDYIRFIVVMVSWLGPIIAMLFVRRTMVHERLPTTNPSLMENSDTSKSERRYQHSYTLPEMLRAGSFYLLAWTLVAQVGAGVSVTQNVGLMVMALKYSDKTVTPAALALFAVGNAVARAFAGGISEHSTRPRPFWLVQAGVVAALAHALLAVCWHEVPFLFSLFLAGVAYGMNAPIFILITNDLFGPKHFSGNFLFIEGLCFAGGSVLFNKVITQHVYEMNLPPGASTCVGRGCFEMTHWITCALCLSSVVSCYCLMYSSLSKQAYSMKETDTKSVK